MKMLNFLFCIYLIAILTGCRGCIEIPKDETYIIEYDNIIIYTDLSSRMYRNPNDTAIINQILDFFVSHCVKPGIKVNDRSAISFSRANYKRSNCPTAKIDIGQFKNLEEKQQFVNNKSHNKNLNDAISEFKDIVRCNYRERDKGGLDLLSLIYNEVNSGNHIKKPEYLISETDTTILYFHNHIFIFTDGYLEYSTKAGSKEFYYGEPQIEAVRKFCRTNKVSPEEAIRNNPQFKIKPLVSENNKLVNLYIMETDDRGFNVQKGTFKNTGDLSDNNILRLVWKIWAEESGFRHFEWRPITAETNLPNDYIQKLIKH
ncbi:MAG: hypothetical protein ACK4EX_08125 [Thermaurantimonas sp.]|uniref:hypothetical protein n=1 Tax=Thermaurantimonas sp. TaxID=2681568 RepID=UPI00391B9553